MEEFDIYKDVSERTDGDIYIGVVGPVRAGKSTFITNFMNKLVLPRVKNKRLLERMTDELPQSANGKAIMTTQPKFVPSEAVTVELGEKLDVRVRLVDCVGYMIDGATGHEEDEKPRMVKTPWFDEPIPFQDAAEIGTKKVISEHSTIGIVLSSDGTIDTDLPRSAYVPAEERVINELKELNKPFIVLLNSKVPSSTETVKLSLALSEKYETPVLAMDVSNMTERDVIDIFKRVLMEFPLRSVDVNVDKWLQALPFNDSIINALMSATCEKSALMRKMSDYEKMQSALEGDDRFKEIVVKSVEPGKGKVTYEVIANPQLFYTALSSGCGMEITDEFCLMSKLKELAHAKREYDKLSSALNSARETGYGIVVPAMDEMTLADPEIVKQGSRYGVKLKATAPSLHIMQVDVSAEVSPVMGAEQQSEDMVKNMLEKFNDNPGGIWETDMFGKSMHALVNEGLYNKLTSMPEDTCKKMRKALSRIVNEGKGGIICILL